MKENFIYFVRQQGTNLVKIGRAQRPHARLIELQVASPQVLTLIGAIAPKRGFTEKSLHRAFASLKYRGEWFKEEGPLAEFIRLAFPSPPFIPLCWQGFDLDNFVPSESLSEKIKTLRADSRNWQSGQDWDACLASGDVMPGRKMNQEAING